MRVRRPDDQATLHFFWLTVAFFGVFAFSFSGRLDALDWVFYWGDVVALLLLPPLFLHFTLVFPERPRQLGAQRCGPRAAAAALSAGGCSSARPGSRRCCARVERRRRPRERHRRCSIAASCSASPPALIGGLAIMLRALGAAASVTARRQLRWIVWGTALGARAIRARLRAAVRARRSHPSLRAAISPRSRSASCRWRSPRRSSATG